jgi:hypothetical protein
VTARKKALGVATEGQKDVVSTANRLRSSNDIAKKSPIGSLRWRGAVASSVVERRPLKPPVRTSKPRPGLNPKPAAPPQPPETGLERLPWILLARDPLGKRAWAKCTACAEVRQIGIADGSIARCGCSGSRHRGAETFAAAVSSEAFAAAGRRRR